MASTDTKPAPDDLQDPWEAMTRARKKRTARRPVQVAAAALAAVLLACGVTTAITAVSLQSAKNEAEHALVKAVEAFKPRQETAPILVSFLYNDPPLEMDVIKAVLRDTNRASANDPGSVGAGKTFTKYATAQSSLTSSLDSLTTTASKHPGLVANKDFTAAAKKLADITPAIADAQTAYNEAAARYNNSRESFPGSVLAPILGHGTPWETFTP
ncbi:MAG: LemA family protein [Arthrobacter sp.]